MQTTALERTNRLCRFFLSKPHGVTGDGQKCCMLFCSSLSRFALCIPYKSHLTLKHGVAFIVKQALHLVCDSLSSVQNEMMAIPGLFSSHPSIRYLLLIQFRIPGGLESIPAVTGRVVGYTLIRSPVYRRANT